MANLLWIEVIFFSQKLVILSLPGATSSFLTLNIGRLYGQ